MRYDGAFGDTGVTVAAGYASNDADTATISEWAGGVVVSMSGVSLGGSMSVMDDDAGNDDLTQFDLGIRYGEGPWSVSANVGNQQDKDANIDNDFARLLANYNLGPGISVAGAIGCRLTQRGR